MRQLLTILGLIISLVASHSINADEPDTSDLDWKLGPMKALIGEQATLDLPAGYYYLDAPNTKKFMEASQNISSGNEYLIAKDGDNWFAVFNFSPTGYVKDNESLDADALLKSIQAGTEAGNVEKRKRGWPTMSITGWRFKPHYDTSTNLLEWAFNAVNDETQEPVINFNTRLLGRTGVMEVTLVAGPDNIDTAVADLKKRLVNYEFVTGEKYSEFRQGDRVAEYGLAALIAGGAAAVAAKKGWFAALLGFLAAAWKIVAAAVVGLLVWLKSLFSKKD
jgi:uncharacterized membrane-anchored protein